MATLSTTSDEINIYLDGRATFLRVNLNTTLCITSIPKLKYTLYLQKKFFRLDKTNKIQILMDAALSLY